METRETIAKKRAERRRRRFRHHTLPRLLFAVLLLSVIAVLIACATSSSGGNVVTDATTGTEAATTEGDTGKPETSRELESSEEPAAFYELTDEERELIEWILSSECRGEPYDGQRAVAQCLLNACLKDDIRPAEALKKYRYTKTKTEPTASIKRAVAAVFDDGDFVTDEPILYFYNPAIVDSAFHESQVHVMTIQNHKFFKEAE